MLENKFYKVRQEGGSYVVATLYNPITKESKTMCVRDYDYFDCSRDNDKIYYMDINEEAVKSWKRYNNIISIGDTIKVIKGRKVAIGTIAQVTNIYNWKDKYGRIQTTYAVLNTGEKTNIHNCIIIDK